MTHVWTTDSHGRTLAINEVAKVMCDGRPQFIVETSCGLVKIDFIEQVGGGFRWSRGQSPLFYAYSSDKLVEDVALYGRPWWE